MKNSGKLFNLLTLQHTLGHVDCYACSEANAMLYQSITTDLLFPEAFRLWLAHRTIESAAPGLLEASYLSRRTLRDYRACATALGKFFWRLKLSEIHAGHLREYQRGRAVCDRAAGAWVKPCGANRIRKEIALLLRILRAARVWGDEQQLAFQALRPVENDVPRALQPDEQQRFLAMAGSRAEWQFILWYAVLALQTTASTNELRAIRLGDVLLQQGILQIRREGAKNKYRIRSIPLETREVVWALENLIARARSLGSVAPHHCLFPIQESKGHYNPCYPMSDSGLKKRWNTVRQAAGLAWLRPYDLRHTAITRMAEAGVPIQVIMSFAGHMTLRMQQHYTTISLVAKRKWAREVWGESAPPAFGPYQESYPMAQAMQCRA
jgi:integrase